MKYLLPVVIAILFPFCLVAQGNMMILKKNGKTIKTYYEGSEIIFDAGAGMQRAQIYDMKKDSLFLVQYEVQQRMTTLGFTVPDTVAAYRSAIHYHEIKSFGRTTSGFWNASGASFFGGGLLLTTAGLLTWVFAKPNTRYYARPELVISAAALTGAGYLIMKSSQKKMVIGKTYSLQYISPE